MVTDSGRVGIKYLYSKHFPKKEIAIDCSCTNNCELCRGFLDGFLDCIKDNSRDKNIIRVLCP